ncbi:MAG: exoribonuclease II [Psychrobium sp.]
MFKDNALLAQLKQNIQESLPKVEGRVKSTDKSFGFLETDDGKSYFIAPPNMKKVMHGDIVSATISSDKGKEQATPVALVSSALSSFIGRVNLNKSKLTVTPPAPYKGSAISAILNGELYVDHGDYIIGELAGHPLNDAPDNVLKVNVVDVVAASNDPFLPWLVTLAKHNATKDVVPIEPPADKDEWSLRKPELARRDLNHELFFTIDGETTQDMDDAISIQGLENGGWALKVAVADPSAYVSAGDETDMAAKARGYTHYLPARTTTMLPNSLSHDICSLRPDVTRPALVCSMVINARGQLQQDAQFELAWITSKAKLSYQQVTSFVKGDEVQLPAVDGIQQALTTLNAFAFARSMWRGKNTQLFDNQPDYRLKLDFDKKISAIDIRHHDVANSMVEEAMLCANISGAAILAKQENGGIFNTHPGFDGDKAKKLAELLAKQGYIYHSQHLLTSGGFCQLQRELTSRNDNYFAARLRKFQLYANIAHQPQPHHGLGAEQYATWTSPIRKYGDLTNHRLIKAAVCGDDMPPLPTEEDALQLKTQRDNQRTIERDLCAWLYIDFLHHAAKNKQKFKAQIFNVNRGGVLARLIKNGATVFIPFSNIHSDRKVLKSDSEAGTISINDEVVYKITDEVTLAITDLNKNKLNITGSLLANDLA